jgi:GDP-4-dehydro-6-deoxy-D-mannose reductase
MSPWWTILDPASCMNLVKSVQPDWILHLAAQSFVPTSWNAPSSTMQTNILGQLNLFEALRALGRLDTRFHVCGSSEEYGFVSPDETPINELNPLRPLSPYGVSKVAQDLLGYRYHRSYGLHAVRTRAFNHGDPRRGHVLLPSDFAKQIAEIEKGLREPVVPGGQPHLAAGLHRRAGHGGRLLAGPGRAHLAMCTTSAQAMPPASRRSRTACSP